MARHSAKGKKGGSGKATKGGKKLSPEDGRDSEQLGRLGEKTFELWGAQANFTPHKSNPDIEGWDYYVQIRDPDAQPKPPFDEVPALQTCKVQVKTVSKHEGKCVLKLSTLRKMIDPNNAWFVLAFVSTDRKTVDAAHLIHISGDRLAEIKKRLRTHRVGRPLSRATITFDWDRADELTPPDAQSFEARVRETIGDPEKYIDAKRKFLSTVGFDKSRFKGSIRFKSTSGEPPYEELSLLAIGLRETVELSEYSVSEVRFGVPQAHRTITEQNRTQVVVPGWEAAVTQRSARSVGEF